MIDLIKTLIKDKAVLILGYGREGRASWQRIKEAGGYRKVAVADLNAVHLGENDPKELIWGSDYQKCLDDFDVVFKSPGIVLERPFEEYRCEIVSETELFFRRYARQCIGITGTKGKSTTTTLIYHILKTAGFDCVLAGNIGIPLFEVIDQMGEETVAVCELSCHQLEYQSVGPHIGVLLNIHEEHLDHYGSMEKYVAAKENIYRTQGEEDVLICNGEILPKTGTCKGNVIAVWDKAFADNRESDIFITGATIQTQNDTYEIPKDKIRLIGHHNNVDIAYAYGVCRLLNVGEDAFTEGLMSYIPLPHRLQYVGEVGGIHFYDDSISTIGETAIQALCSLPQTDAILIGGMDRGIDYTDLIEYLSESTVLHIILMEETGLRIYQEILRDYPCFGKPERLVLVRHLAEAVTLAKMLCRKGKACVMSPAAASYGIFKNFEERGDVFQKLVLGGK